MTASIACSGTRTTRAEVAEHVLGEREMRVVGVRAGADAGHPLLHRGRRVRHRADDGDVAAEVRLDLARRDSGGDGEERLLGGEEAADVLEERAHVLLLHGDRR